MEPDKLQRNKQRSKYLHVGRFTTIHNILFCAHALWMNYVTVTFLLVSSSGTNHDMLCFVPGHGQKENKKEQR